MFSKICLIFVAVMVVSSEVIGDPSTNYELSRTPLGKQLGNQLGGFGIRDLVDLLLGGNYGQQPGYYPGGSGYGGYYPGGSGGYYPGHHKPPGPPGAHPGCPLCDSSVYSYCYHKQAHDSCCCGDRFNLFGCGKTDCNFLYANSCEENQLITNCCCVDLDYKNSGEIKPTDVI